MSGGPDRTRTCDLRFRKPLLYPLSYGTNPVNTGTCCAAVAPPVRWGNAPGKQPRAGGAWRAASIAPHLGGRKTGVCPPPATAPAAL